MCDSAANWGVCGVERGGRGAWDHNWFRIDAVCDDRYSCERVGIVEGAGAENGGIILDTWHVAKPGIPCEEGARYLISVELNDGTFKARWDLHEDTINHKRLCGEDEREGFHRQRAEGGLHGALWH